MAEAGYRQQTAVCYMTDPVALRALCERYTKVRLEGYQGGVIHELAEAARMVLPTLLDENQALKEEVSRLLGILDATQTDRDNLLRQVEGR